MGFPINFVSDEVPTLRVRYLLNIKQYSISESAYLFYRQIVKNNESGGSLFDQQQGSIPGNIHGESDPSKSVIGYFEVSGVSSKSTFFTPGDFVGTGFEYPDFPFDCNNLFSTADRDSVFIYLQQTGGNLVDTASMSVAYYLSNIPCTSCTFYADPIEPEYWQ